MLVHEVQIVQWKSVFHFEIMQSKILLVAGAPSDAEVVDPLAVAVHEGGEGEGDAPLHGLHALHDIGHLGGGVAHGHQGWATQVIIVMI